MKRTALAILVAICTTAPISADWLQFRGPSGLGFAPDKGTPLTWSADSNITWKIDLPGAGGGTPIVVGEKVFVACYSGYGMPRGEAGEQKDLKRHLVCVDRKTGKTLWKRDIEAVLPEAAYSGPFITLHGYASSTPISDGKNVYIFMGKSGVYAFDLDGKQLWHASVGTGTNGWGTGTSPILYKNLLIVNASVESKSLVALDKNTGKEVWKAGGITQSWNTPVLAKLANGATELVVAAAKKMIGFDPDTGKELWHADTYNWYVCPSIVANDGVLYGLQHYICVAVKGGGRGDVTASHVLWKKDFGAVVASPLFYQGHIYWAANGTAHCVNASDGTTAYKERLKSKGDFYAAPVLADGKLYYVNRTDGVSVVEASPKFKLLAFNTLGDKSIFNANPAISRSQLFLRSDQSLYCIGKEK